MPVLQRTGVLVAHVDVVRERSLWGGESGVVEAELDTIMETEVATLNGTVWGDMAVNINRFEPGCDLSPMIAQLSTGSCQVAHWGYVIEGSWTIGYLDGSTETVAAGEVFYLPPGHNSVVTETGCLIAEFSPAAEMAALQEELGALLAE
jgi:glyoxylate utilization-related uncharacterized protein